MKKIQIVFLIGLSMAILPSSQANLPPNYQSWGASQKQEKLFELSSAQPYSIPQLQSHKDNKFDSARKLISVRRLTKSFTHQADEWQKPQRKIVHTFGAVAKVELIPVGNHKYTGLFASGAQGILRLSLAKMEEPFTPGLALKLLIDGVPSKNIFAMYSLDGQGSNYNFFENSFTNKINDPRDPVLKFFEKRFRKTLKELKSSHGQSTLQALTDIGIYERDGFLVASPITPFALIFDPTDDAPYSKTPYINEAKSDFRLRLRNARYDDGLILYDVYAKETEASLTKELIGQVILRSRFVSNEYGDRQLFFQHNID